MRNVQAIQVQVLPQTKVQVMNRRRSDNQSINWYGVGTALFLVAFWVIVFKSF